MTEAAAGAAAGEWVLCAPARGHYGQYGERHRDRRVHVLVGRRFATLCGRAPEHWDTLAAAPTAAGIAWADYPDLCRRCAAAAARLGGGDA
jgi:hypothetical protein